MRIAVCTAALVLVASSASAQGVQPLTAESYAKAVADGKVGKSIGYTDKSILTDRLKAITAAHRGFSYETAAMDLASRIDEAPFLCVITTPYTRAAAAAYEATRHYEDLKPGDLDALNAGQIVIHVSSGSDFTVAGSIDAMVIKRGEAVIRPLKSEVTPTTIENRVGATRTVTEGLFTFTIGTFAPGSLPLTLVLIGRSGNSEVTLTPDEVAALR